MTCDLVDVFWYNKVVVVVLIYIPFSVITVAQLRIIYAEYYHIQSGFS